MSREDPSRSVAPDRNIDAGNLGEPLDFVPHPPAQDGRGFFAETVGASRDCVDSVRYQRRPRHRVDPDEPLQIRHEALGRCHRRLQDIDAETLASDLPDPGLDQRPISTPTQIVKGPGVVLMRRQWRLAALFTLYRRLER